MNDINWSKWCRKELLYSLQAKGKLERPATEAGSRRDKAYHDTEQRVFPQKDNEENMSRTLLLEARRKLADSHNHKEQHNQQLQPPKDASKHKEHRQAIKAKLRQLEDALATQHAANTDLEQQINGLSV